ncbi:alpha/beta hydrolase [Paenarthrobacter sp. NPDC056912]|uniref:alpha/beta hydrolase n=1 Tax=Paenarthrobacter sp. NPDC056912 TaxID=3345965 RepID=UPI0036715CFD
MTAVTTHDTEPAIGSAFWETPAGVNPRGTLIVLTGRGEHSGIYARLGRRLSSDGYRVHVVETGSSGQGRERTAELLASSDPRTPRVIVGSDTGAAAALAAGAPGPKGKARPDAIIVAALPLGTAVTALPDAEARSACPVHRGLFSDTANLNPGALAAPLGHLDLPVPETVAPPVLVFHGEADPVVPAADAARWAARLPRGRFVETTGGLRDAFNDVSHRSVAATVVLFLEDLRTGGPNLK